MRKKVYRVVAQYTKYAYAEVEAESENEALSLAETMDHDDFTLSVDYEWEVLRADFLEDAPLYHNSIEYAKYFANLVKKSYPEYKVDAYGPFGLRAYSVLSVKTSDNKIVGILTVEQHEDGFYYETGKTNGINYPPGSIGDLNGFNNEVAKLPEDEAQVLDIIFESKGEKNESNS